MKNKSMLRRIFVNTSKLISNAFGFSNPKRVHSVFLENINPHKKIILNDREILFSCPNELIHWRIGTFFEKEPETLSWISNMKSGDVFYDIGANIGLYSLFASIHGLRVLAFEPEALNYSELVKNVFMNQFVNIKPINLALGRSQKFVTFHTQSHLAGTANQESDLILESLDTKQSTQTSFCISIDSLIEIYEYEVPNYIKIDVDGPELEIIQGMKNTLKNINLKSILIEIDENHSSHREIIDILSEEGFKISFRTEHEAMINNYIFNRI